jgi:polyisoprenyl-teichoic acid--peptidoglycan teichoic acid transferase
VGRADTTRVSFDLHRDAPPALVWDQPGVWAPARTERRKRRWPKVLAGVAFVGVLLVAAAAVASYLYAQGLVDRFSSGTKAPVVAAARTVLNTTPRAVPAAAAAPAALTTGRAVETFLLIGSDTRGGERGRSDTMILARLDRSRHTLSMLSIPRDLQVTIPGHGVDKINAAYSYGGPALAIATVRDTFHVVINHFVVIDFRGFQRVVAKLGGAYLPIDQRYHHVSSGTGSEAYSSIDLQPGYQKLNGADALSWVRYRHGDSDFFRAARQQLFLRELKRQLGASGHLTALPGVLGAVADSITSDVKSVRTVWSLVGALRSIPGDRIHRVVLEADGGLQGGIYYLVATEAQRQAAIAEWTRTSASHPARVAPRARRSSNGTPPVGLRSDEQAAALLRSVRPTTWPTCAPTLIAPNAHWASDTPVRSYTLAGHPAIALVGEFGPGEHYLWTETTWDAPPILDGPSEQRVIDGRPYDLYWEGTRLRMIAFRVGATRVWLTNTLRNDLLNQRMVAMAASCRPAA